MNDGIASIWNNKKLNSTLTVDLQLHLLNLRRGVTANADSCDARKLKVTKLINDYYIKLADAELRWDTVLVAWEADRLDSNIRKVLRDTTRFRARAAALSKVKKPARIDPAREQIVRDSLFREVAKILAEDSTKREALKKLPIDGLLATLRPDSAHYAHRADSLAKAVVRMRAELGNKRRTLSTLRQMDTAGVIGNLNNWYNAERDKILGVQVKGLDIGWISVGYGLAAAKFFLFDPALPYAKQVTKGLYGAHEVRLQYARYYRLFAPRPVCPGATAKRNARRAKRRPAYFYSIGLSGGIADNHEELEKVDLEEQTEQVIDSTSRTVVTEYTALKGTYEKSLLRCSLYADLYYFIMRMKNDAIHIFPTYDVKERTTPSLNVGLGFYIGLVKKDSPQNTANIEPFLLLKDVANGASANGNVWNRSDIGIRLSFPFNFPKQP